MNWINLKDQQPPSKTVIRVRYRNRLEGWAYCLIPEKHINDIESKIVEWAPLSEAPKD